MSDKEKPKEEAKGSADEHSVARAGNQPSAAITKATRPSAVSHAKSSSEICKTCGFDKELEREPIIMDNNELSFICWDEGRCEECCSQKDGWTITGNNQFAKINAHWKAEIHELHERYNSKMKEGCKNAALDALERVEKELENESINQDGRVRLYRYDDSWENGVFAGLANAKEILAQAKKEIEERYK